MYIDTCTYSAVCVCSCVCSCVCELLMCLLMCCYTQYRDMYIDTCTYYTHTHPHTRARTHTHTCTRTHAHAHTHTRTHAHTHAHTHTHRERLCGGKPLRRRLFSRGRIGGDIQGSFHGRQHALRRYRVDSHSLSHWLHPGIDTREHILHRYSRTHCS